MTDEELIGLYFARSEEAIEATRRQYGAYCLAVAGRILGCPEDAEECISDVWLRAWEAIPPLRPASLKGWLGTVARNAALSMCRARARQPERGGDGALELACPAALGSGWRPGSWGRPSPPS